MFGYCDEVVLDALAAVRNALKGPASKEGVKLSFMPFFIKVALRNVNALLTLCSGRLTGPDTLPHPQCTRQRGLQCTDYASQSQHQRGHGHSVGSPGPKYQG